MLGLCSGSGFCQRAPRVRLGRCFADSRTSGPSRPLFAHFRTFRHFPHIPPSWHVAPSLCAPERRNCPSLNLSGVAMAAMDKCCRMVLVNDAEGMYKADWVGSLAANSSRNQFRTSCGVARSCSSHLAHVSMRRRCILPSEHAFLYVVGLLSSFLDMIPGGILQCVLRCNSGVGCGSILVLRAFLQGPRCCEFDWRIVRCRCRRAFAYVARAFVHMTI